MGDLVGRIQDQLRYEGYDIDGLEIDHRHPQVQNPTDTVAVEVGRFLRTVVYRHFYAKLFRWKSGNMRHGILLRPKIVGHGANAREDIEDMVGRLRDAVKQTCARNHAVTTHTSP